MWTWHLGTWVSDGLGLVDVRGFFPPNQFHVPLCSQAGQPLLQPWWALQSPRPCQCPFPGGLFPVLHPMLPLSFLPLPPCSHPCGSTGLPLPLSRPRGPLPLLCSGRYSSNFLLSTGKASRGNGALQVGILLTSAQAPSFPCLPSAPRALQRWEFRCSPGWLPMRSIKRERSTKAPGGKEKLLMHC